MPDALDPYTVLGVPRSATPAEITHAYRQKLRAQHPDTRGPQEGAAPGDEQLQRLLAAYAILRDSARRAAFDRTARTAAQRQTEVTTPRGAQSVDIPVTHNARARTDPARTPPLWAGPVRRHR